MKGKQDEKTWCKSKGWKYILDIKLTRGWKTSDEIHSNAMKILGMKMWGMKNMDEKRDDRMNEWMNEWMMTT